MSFFTFIKSQLSNSFLTSQFTTVPYPTMSFTGQTIIVTGANTGLGMEAARHYVRLGASKVIIASRSIANGEAAVESITESTGRAGVCEVWQLDMASYDSVKAFAKRCEGLDRLDIVNENAGVAKLDYTEAEGMESTITINVIGTFLLALLLLPILRKSRNKTGLTPRLVITSSEVHAQSKFNERQEDSIFDALAKNNPEYISDRYRTSKLLQVFFVHSLAAAVSQGSHANEPVIINNVNPGLCRTTLSRYITGLHALSFAILLMILGRTSEAGSRTLVASGAAGMESHGMYMTLCKVGEPSPFVTSEEGKQTERRIHEELMAILEKIQPGISNNI